MSKLLVCTVYICTKVQDLRVQSIYCHYVRNNIYYDEAGIITIFLHGMEILGIMWIICINIHKLGSFLNK